MAKVTKTQEQILAERNKASELMNRILKATEGIPRHIMNGASVQTVIAFKAAAEKARKMATTKRYATDPHKMREAWNHISSYYKGV